MKIFRDSDAITVKVGEKFGVALKVLGAAGFEWQLQGQPELVRSLGSEFKVPSGRVGAESEQILQFEARKKGQAVLQLVCRRPWDSQPDRTLSLKLKVTE